MGEAEEDGGAPRKIRQYACKHRRAEHLATGIAKARCQVERLYFRIILIFSLIEAIEHRRLFIYPVRPWILVDHAEQALDQEQECQSDANEESFVILAGQNKMITKKYGQLVTSKDLHVENHEVRNSLRFLKIRDNFEQR